MAGKFLYSTGSLSRGLDRHGISHTVRDKQGASILPWGSNENLSLTSLVWTIKMPTGLWGTMAEHSVDLTSAEVHGLCIGLTIANNRGEK